MRRLSADEQALWERVAATIRPLSRDLLPKAPAAPPIAAAAVLKPAKGRVPPLRTAPPRPESPVAPHAAQTLDGSWDKRLSRGQISPDRTIDLHGHTLDRAWGAIDIGLDRAIRAGERVVLLITGHAPKGEPPVQRGRIRAAVHDWLGASRHAGRIAAVRSAHPRHGGGGSLYVILRRG